VGHDDEDVVVALVQVEQQRRDNRRRGLIEVAGRLVAEHQARLVDERARDGDALLLAARQLAGPVLDAVAKPDLLDQLTRQRRPIAPLRLLGAAGDERRHQDVLDDRALRQQAVILKDEADLLVAEVRQLGGRQRERVAAVERHRAGRGGLERAQDVEQRALAASRGAGDRGRLPRREGERDVRQHRERAARRWIALADAGDAKWH
jgi:hypothetical protein